MSTVKIRPPVIDDYTDRSKREVRTAIQQLTSATGRSVVVTNVALSSSTTQVPHRLGQQPTGWIIVDKTAQADIWRDTSVAVTNDLFPLKASTNVTVSIQFFY